MTIGTALFVIALGALVLFAPRAAAALLALAVSLWLVWVGLVLYAQNTHETEAAEARQHLTITAVRAAGAAGGCFHDRPLLVEIRNTSARNLSGSLTVAFYHEGYAEAYSTPVSYRYVHVPAGGTSVECYAAELGPRAVRLSDQVRAVVRVGGADVKYAASAFDLYRVTGLEKGSQQIKPAPPASEATAAFAARMAQEHIDRCRGRGERRGGDVLVFCPGDTQPFVFRGASAGVPLWQYNPATGKVEILPRPPLSEIIK